jgi:ribosomal-protein-alanine N-acetyltransferase
VTAPGWPVTLREDRVGLRPLRLRDGASWVQVRLRNEQWLAPWEATPPAEGPPGRWEDRQTLAVYARMVRFLRRQARAGVALPLAVTYDEALAGQLTVSTIVRGAFNSGSVGYWVDHRVAGQGVLPTALALVVDHCFRRAGLHRIEANIRPENHASRRAVEKLGFREEGLHRRLLAIDGAYRDHISYAVTAEDVPEGMLTRWRRVQASRAGTEA